jgi:hypothetical protein
MIFVMKTKDIKFLTYSLKYVALYLCIVYKIQSMKLVSVLHRNKIKSNFNSKFNQYLRTKGSVIFSFVYIISLIAVSKSLIIEQFYRQITFQRMTKRSALERH